MRSSKAGSGCPRGFECRVAAAVAVNGKDEVCLIYRGEHSVVVYDRNGNFTQTWCEEEFAYRSTHGRCKRGKVMKASTSFSA
jgi:hypothetical protein